MKERTSVGTVDDLHEAASRMTGLDDFGSDDYLEPLGVLVDSLNTEAGLTSLGYGWQRSSVRGALAARLLSQAAFGSNPTYADVAVPRPVFVTGMRRSGTTLMQRLLAADPGSQVLEMWLTQLPQPRPPRETWDDDPIYAAMRFGFDAHQEAHPEIAAIHYTHADTSEECWYLLQQSFLSASWPALAHVPSYRAFLQDPTTDWSPAYRRHRQNLQLIGLHDQDKHWVLKNPSHLASLDALLEVYPDAMIVVTHRDPVVAVTSSCSLAAVSTRGWSETFVGQQLGHDVLDWAAWELEQFADARRRHPEATIVDVEYDDLVRDPIGTLRHLYPRIGLGWHDEIEQRMELEYEASRSGPRAPRHQYELSDYGLTPTQVLNRLS